MIDLSDTIVPKSDQLNADDLIAGPITVTIERVSKMDGDQPVSVHIGNGRQPYKPCKSMRRVMIAAWGKNGDDWVGQSMTLYNDPTVQWGGKTCGGIRISHMTGIENARTFQLTVTRGKRTPYTVEPLRQASRADRCREWLAGKGFEVSDAETLIGKSLEDATADDFAKIGRMK